MFSPYIIIRLDLNYAIIIIITPLCTNIITRTRAAVALDPGQSLEVMEVELDGPKAGEVLIEIKATGLCHTDEFTRSSADPRLIFGPFWATRAQVLSGKSEKASQP